MQKMQLIKKNYGMDELKMLVIVKACKHWQHYLESTTYKMHVIINHCNLHIFFTTKNLTRHKARWWE